jgi:hypothetical protein
MLAWIGGNHVRDLDLDLQNYAFELRGFDAKSLKVGRFQEKQEKVAVHDECVLLITLGSWSTDSGHQVGREETVHVENEAVVDLDVVLRIFRTTFCVQERGCDDRLDRTAYFQFSQ